MDIPFRSHQRYIQRITGNAAGRMRDSFNVGQGRMPFFVPMPNEGRRQVSEDEVDAQARQEESREFRKQATTRRASRSVWLSTLSGIHSPSVVISN
jgi:hypothetical protein